jgi:hypothetical protein
VELTITSYMCALEVAIALKLLVILYRVPRATLMIKYMEKTLLTASFALLESRVTKVKLTTDISATKPTIVHQGLSLGNTHAP